MMKTLYIHQFVVRLTFFVVVSSSPSAAQDDSAKLPLHTELTRAIRLEKMDEIKRLINPESVNQPDRGGYHPLSYAAYIGSNTLMESLLRAGANPNVVEKNGKTALYITANMANVKGIALLHKYKAKTPPDSALSPAKAAVHSGSVDCFKVLLHYYPDIDLQSGWDNRDDQGRMSEDSPGDPISYAAYHGYSDIALILLGKNVRPTGRDYLGKTALHHAAINTDCTPALVKALLEARSSPIQNANRPYKHYPYLGLTPRTPLDYAVLSGNGEKVKFLALAAKPELNRDVLRNAAHIAAAYDKKITCQYLLNLIGEKMTGYREFLGVELQAKTQATTTTEMKAEELDRIMPRTRTRPGDLPGEGTVAIISDPNLRDEAALLSVELSRKAGIELVERDQLDALAAEQSLRGFGKGDSDALHQSLNLIPARNVVIYSSQALGKNTFVRASVIDSASGLIVASHALPVKALVKKEGARDMANAVSFSIGESEKVGTAVSITPIAPQTMDAEAAMAARNINTLLAHFASNTKGLSALSRRQLQHLQREKVIGVEGSYWAAAWVIDGGMGVLNNGKAELTLRAIHAVSQKEIKASSQVEVDQLDVGLRKCWRELVLKFQPGSFAKERNVAAAKDALEKEAQVLQRHAQWLYDAFYYQQAGKLMDACLAIGHRSKERVKLALMIQAQLTSTASRARYISQTPNGRQYAAYDPEYETYGKMGMYANMYHASARAVTHEVRLYLMDQSERYLRLGQLAEDRLKMNVQMERSYKWANETEYDRGMEQTLHPFVTHSLGELLFYITAMDHTMVKSTPEGMAAFDSVSEQIHRITKQYLENLEKLKDRQKVNAARVKLKTVEYLLSRDYEYFSRHEPELFSRMLEITRYALRSNQDSSMIKPMFELSASKAILHKESGNKSSSAAWKGLMIAAINEGKQGGVELLNTNPLYLYSGREKRLEWLAFLVNQPFSIQNNAGAEMAIGVHPIGDLVGMDCRSQRLASNEMAESCLIEDLDALEGTAEYARVSGCYRVVDHLKARNDASLLAFLTNRTEITKARDGYRYAQEWSPEVWTRIKTVLSKSRELTPDVRDLLERLSGGDDADSSEEGEIRLLNKDVIVMPKQKGHEKRVFNSIPERADILGDELWLPGMYEIPRIPRLVPNEDDNAIQVVSLSDQSVKTVILPRKPHKFKHGEVLLHQRDRFNYSKLMLTNEYAYYNPNGDTLFCIRRDNHKVMEIRILAGFKNPQIKLMDANPELGMVLAEIGERDARLNTHQAILIKGDQVHEVLASNRRKPAKGPMDQLKINHYVLEFHGNEAWVGHERTYLAYAYNTDTKKWKKLGKSMVPEMQHRRSLRLKYDHYKAYPRKLYLHFEEGPRCVYAGLWHTNSRVASMTQPLKDIFDKHRRGQIKITVEPSSHPEFASEWFPKLVAKGNEKSDPASLWPRDRYMNKLKGWWVSPKQAIQDGHFRVNIIGKWNNHVVMGVMCQNLTEDLRAYGAMSNKFGLAAVWSVPESKFNSAIKPLVDRRSRMIDFESASMSSQYAHVASLDFLGGKKDYRWAARKPIEIFGGGVVLKITPAMEVESMELAIGISRTASDKKLNFRIETGPKENPTELFNSRNHELGTADKVSSKSTVMVSLPDGIKEFRLTHDSPRDHRLRIHQILFLDSSGRTSARKIETEN